MVKVVEEISGFSFMALYNSMGTKSHKDGGWHCPNCGEQTYKLIGRTANGDVGCPQCTEVNIRISQGILHQYNHKDSRGLSEAKARVIDNRVKAPDGSIIDRRTGKPTER